MILVAGTKRSGTSLWMQVLIAAGYPPIGEAFPKRWADRPLRDANPEGFFESTLRQGIYYATNPDPKTGVYLFPDQTEHHVVKVFIPGLVRTDRAYIKKVIATMRPWREYVASISRLNELDDAGREGPPPYRMPPALEWWAENFALIRDITTRRYAVHVETFDRLLAEPEQVIRAALGWLSGGDLEEANVERATGAVKPEHRTFERAEPDPSATELIDAEAQSVFDALYDAVQERSGLTPELLSRMSATQQRLLPELARQDDLRRAALASRAATGSASRGTP